MPLTQDVVTRPVAALDPFKSPARGALHFVRVFAAASGGGNPAPVIFDADELSSDEMREIAARYGHESAFVCAPRDVANTFRLRYFVPNHEMEMCGHATLGALWLLRESGRWTSETATIETMSGIVDVRFNASTQLIEVGQPEGTVKPIADAHQRQAICDVLNVAASDLDAFDIVNATTSRTKTLIALRSVERLHALQPSFADVRALCDALDSTGLYPFAVAGRAPLEVHARQLPRASGYPEDAATGIAAAATLYGAMHFQLLAHGETGITVLQGYAMGKPSRIRVQLRDPDRTEAGCWISGSVERMTLEPIA
jgi:trans-2,3-dihydro-3-hydroxyanthranilate isomerase